MTMKNKINRFLVAAVIFGVPLTLLCIMVF